tara:strand:+ start:4087 stop:4596 length:510 start_codon:yes stop_codon:yes gene_type:complete
MFLTLYIEYETQGYFLFDKYFKYCIKERERQKMITTNKTIEQLVGEKPFYVSYFKKDGTIREMPQAILHEIDLAKIKNPNINKTQIIVFDNDKEGYRTVNIDKIIEISRGEEFKLVDSKYNELIEEDKIYQKIDTEKDMENYILNKILKNIKTEREVINGTRSIRILEK